jgi:uncharacterized protein (DUF169 family)
VSAPYLTGDIAYTLGDLAGRRFSKMDDGEIFLGIPFEKMDMLLTGLEKIAERHGSN